MRDAPKKILLILPKRLGDTILHTPAIRHLKQALPDVCLEAVALTPLSAEVVLSNPRIDRLWRWPDARELAQAKPPFDWTLCCFPCDAAEGYASAVSAPGALMQRVPEKTHTSIEIADLISEALGIDTKPLSYAYELPFSGADLASVTAKLEAQRVPPDRNPVVGYHLGYRTPAKRRFKFWKSLGRGKMWPVEHVITFASRLRATFPDMTFLVTGTRAEERLAQHLKRAIPEVVDLVDHTSVGELAALMSLLDCYVTADTGAMHVAASTDVPVVAFSGPSSEHITGPYPGHDHHILLRGATTNTISIDDALDAVRRYLAPKFAAGRCAMDSCEEETASARPAQRVKGNSPPETLSVAGRNGVKWHIKSTCPEVVDIVRDLDIEHPGALVKKNSRRRVYHLVAKDAGEPGYYLKCDYPKSFRYRLRAHVLPKARREFLSAVALAAAGVPVVDCVAWGRRGSRSFLLSKECPGGVPMREAWETCRGEEVRREHFLAMLGSFLATMLKVRVCHPDLHTENVLVAENDGSFRFFLVDIYGVRVDARWAPRYRSKILGLAAALGREMTLLESERLMLVTGAVASRSDALPEWRRQLWSFVSDQRKRWPGRRRRMLTSSSLCERWKNSHGTWLSCPDLPLADAEQAVALHRANTASDRGILKRGSKRQVSRVRVGDRTLVIKEFFSVGWRGVWRPDRAAWLNAYRLGLSLVPAARCCGWLRARDGNGFLVFEDLGPLTLEHALAQERPASERCCLLSAAGRLTGWLHAARIIHRDLTAANFLVVPGPSATSLPLKLIDYDRIRLYPRNCPKAKRVHNLVQLLELLVPNTTIRERLLVLAAYRREIGDSRQEFRRLLHELETALPGVLTQ